MLTKKQLKEIEDFSKQEVRNYSDVDGYVALNHIDALLKDREDLIFDLKLDEELLRNAGILVRKIVPIEDFWKEV